MAGDPALDEAMAGYDQALFQDKSQDEIRKELPISAAYRDETSPVEEEVEVDVDGEKKTVSIVRYLSGIEILQYRGDVLWTCIAAFLVFIMQAGFAMLEAGFTRAKNAVNICMKNIMDFSIGTVAFLAIGFHLMFAGPDVNLFWLGIPPPPSGDSLSGSFNVYLPPPPPPSYPVAWPSAPDSPVTSSTASSSVPLYTPHSAVGRGAVCWTATDGWRGSWVSVSTISPVPLWFIPSAVG